MGVKKDFIDKINILIQNKKYKDALEKLNNQLEKNQENEDKDYFFLAEIIGLYIDLGEESLNSDTIQKGLDLIIQNRNLLLTKVTEESIDYCSGNGFNTLYKIAIAKDNSLFPPTPEEVKLYLFDSKQSFFRAYKKIDLQNLNDFSIKILTNLANNLQYSGRIVESLQLFDIVLSYNPDFPQAIVSKAEGLVYLIRSTNSPQTISLYTEIYRLYMKATNLSIESENIRMVVDTGLKNTREILELNNYDFHKLDEDLLLNNIEYQSHSKELKLYLDNFMSLSEHSLYCNCNGSKIDDLAISYPRFKTNNDKIFLLELILNRIKSEFSLSRRLYFEYFNEDINDNVYYENSANQFLYGIKYEKLRTSFRLCFGILDKIAEGICYLFEIETKQGESIYFESFWNPRQNIERWNKINSFQNIHLSALFSIACDLNKSTGEFGFYKNWRNTLEHGIFSITKTLIDEKTKKQDKFREHTTIKNFENETKHLIQLTRATIFSFVYCIRKELI